ncbi:MAG: hypothetical protein KJO11_06935 [Gemmatimonadetes bacterium]|nr:hypothetical protein [Gemmatimonadota bacterium]
MKRFGLWAAAFLVACGPGAPDDSGMVVSSDRQLQTLAAELLPGLSERSGLELRRPVRLERRTRAELERYLVAKLDEEFPPDRSARVATSYHLLGLAPADLDLRGLLLAVYREQVAGFYDPDSTALFVLADQERDALRPLLLHELVHAVQDQTVDLDALTAPELGNDRRMAAQAAIEGHATLVMMEQVFGEMQGDDIDMSVIPDMGAELRSALASAETQFPALAAAPAVLREGLLFPYLEGAGYVLEVWRDGAARGSSITERLPVSTEQVLHPDRAWGEAADLPTALEVTVEGADVVHGDGLGQAETRVLLRELSGDPTLEAEGWDGDRYVLIEVPAVAGAGDEESAGAAGLVWATVWDDVAARDAFVTRLDALTGGFPRPATVEPVEVDGLPGALLRVGFEGPIEIRVQGGAP